MKITLISPYFKIKGVGFRIISSCLKLEKHDVQLIFLPKREFNVGYENKILEQISLLTKDSNLIGFSLMTNHFYRTVEITKKIREKNNCAILWGGIHPTLKPEECLNYADMVCLGEGEESIVELANKMEKGKYYYDVRGIWYKQNKIIIKNSLRPLIQSLDDLPFPDYDYKNHFILIDKNIESMDSSILSKQLRQTYSFLMTRGCPFRCTYCCHNALMKIYPEAKHIRKRSVNNVIKELKGIKKRLPFIKSITAQDDSFLSLSVDEVNEFCKQYIQTIALPFRISGVNPLTITREKLSFLVNAGCNRMRVGIQTGSERTQKLYNRHYTNKQVENAAKIINELYLFTGHGRIVTHRNLIRNNNFTTD